MADRRHAGAARAPSSVIYVLLGLFAAYYLLPLFVVFLNSFRDAAGDRRRTG